VGYALQLLMAGVAAAIALNAWYGSMTRAQDWGVAIGGVLFIAILAVCCSRWGFSYEPSRDRTSGSNDHAL